MEMCHIIYLSIFFDRGKTEDSIKAGRLCHIKNSLLLVGIGGVMTMDKEYILTLIIVLIVLVNSIKK